MILEPVDFAKQCGYPYPMRFQLRAGSSEMTELEQAIYKVWLYVSGEKELEEFEGEA